MTRHLGRKKRDKLCILYVPENVPDFSQVGTTPNTRRNTKSPTKRGLQRAGTRCGTPPSASGAGAGTEFRPLKGADHSGPRNERKKGEFSWEKNRFSRREIEVISAETFVTSPDFEDVVSRVACTSWCNNLHTARGVMRTVIGTVSTIYRPLRNQRELSFGRACT